MRRRLCDPHRSPSLLRKSGSVKVFVIELAYAIALLGPYVIIAGAAMTALGFSVLKVLE